MELRHLKAFERAAREGSFSAAAIAMDLAQPTVSARVAALEAEMGGPLFERGGRRLHLTPLGEKLLPYAERILALVASSHQIAANQIAGKQSPLTVAALDTLTMGLLQGPIKRFRRQYPAVDIHVRFRRPGDILDALYDGEATLGLMGAPLWDKNIRIMAHFQEPIVAVCATDHPLAALESVTLGDICHHTLLSVTLNPRVTAMVEGTAETARTGSGGAVIWLPAILAQQLLVQGEGVAFLPQSFVQYNIDTGRLVVLPLEEAPFLTNEPLLVALRGRELDEPALAFVRLMRQEWHSILVTDYSEG